MTILHQIGYSVDWKDNFDLNLNISWEIDLWGKLKKEQKAQKSQSQASIADLKYLQ